MWYIGVRRKSGRGQTVFVREYLLNAVMSQLRKACRGEGRAPVSAFRPMGRGAPTCVTPAAPAFSEGSLIVVRTV